jgi:hypothetical protein
MKYLIKFSRYATTVLMIPSACTTQGFQTESSAHDYTGLLLRVTTGRIFAIGDGIPVAISLTNSTDAAVEVLSLDSAVMEFNLTVHLLDGRVYNTSLKPTGGDSSFDASHGP